MANTRAGNSYYIDTQYSVAADELAAKNLKVLGILLTTSSAGGLITLTDNGVTKLTIKGATDEDSSYYDFSNSPILFGTSIRPTALSGAVATVIIQESSGG